MADRVLVWHREGTIRGDEDRIGPTYYLDADYEQVDVRIHAERAPNTDDAEFDIRVDNVSIFANRTPKPEVAYGRVAQTTLTTSALLSKGDNYGEWAEDFKRGVVLNEGSWVHCKPIRGGNGKNFTVSLELKRIE